MNPEQPKPYHQRRIEIEAEWRAACEQIARDKRHGWIAHFCIILAGLLLYGSVIVRILQCS